MLLGDRRRDGRARLAAAGWTVYATARRPETLAELEAKGCRTLALDVTDEASRKAAVDAVVEAEGAVGVLVNNAGYSQSGAVESVADERVRAQFDTNVFGLLAMCRLVLPGMREQRWGKIVNVSSMGGRFTFPGGGIYHATKYAVEALSDALRFEVKAFGVDVIIVEPGIIKTNFGETAVARDRRATQDSGPYAEFNQAVAEATAGVYEKRTPRQARRPARGGRRKIEKRPLRQPPAGALHGHRVGARPAGKPRGAAGRGLGRDAARPVPAARQALTNLPVRLA